MRGYMNEYFLAFESGLGVTVLWKTALLYLITVIVFGAFVISLMNAAYLWLRRDSGQD